MALQTLTHRVKLLCQQRLGDSSQDETSMSAMPSSVSQNLTDKTEAVHSIAKLCETALIFYDGLILR